MTRQYKDLCREYSCKAKVFPLKAGALKNLGQPDLVILFTSTVSHTMVRCVLSNIDRRSTVVARCHSSSMAALKNVLEEHTA